MGKAGLFPFPKHGWMAGPAQQRRIRRSERRSARRSACHSVRLCYPHFIIPGILASLLHKSEESKEDVQGARVPHHVLVS